ncbi:MAG: hypothetical protein PHT33_04600 [bacterium]|nr:hypothetical protein [bacterium]
MKRIVLAIALVALFAVPAMAQNVDFTFNGDLIGAYADDTEAFQLYSFIDRDYSNVSMNAKVGDRLVFTYRVGLDEFVSGMFGVNSPYTREAYVSLLNVAPAISEVRVGEFTFPFAAQQWLGYHRGVYSNAPQSATGNGVMVSGSFAPVNYSLAVTNAADSLGGRALVFGNDEKPLWAKVSTDLGMADVGLSYVKQDVFSVWGVNAAFDAGIVGVTAEYLVLQQTGADDLTRGFLGANVPVAGPLSVFGKYYLADEGVGSMNAFAFGADYAFSSNATLRVENMSDKNGIWAGDVLEAQLRVSF